MTEDWKKFKSQIYLIYLNETGYIFSNNDYMKLRSEFRIIGKFIGAPRSRGYSSNSNSTPVELNKFETQLLLEKGIIILLKKHILLVAPIATKTEEFLNLFQSRVNQQEDSFINNTFEQSKLNIGRILFGKKKKLQRSSRSEFFFKINEANVLDDLSCGINFLSHNALLDISCEHLHKHDAELLTEYPRDNSLKYNIFKDIWEKGYYITSGIAFGADFIVYPGDPLIYHASYIIIVDENALVNIYDLSAKCRLSVTVNKLFIYAYQNYGGKILYQTIHWKGQRGNSMVVRIIKIQTISNSDDSNIRITYDVRYTLHIRT